MLFVDTAKFSDPAWAAGHEDYFTQRINLERLNADPVYAAGAAYAAEDYGAEDERSCRRIK